MRNKKAFSLVEMLVTMAIIAVILGLALFGIAAAQRNSRNTQRRAALSDINVAMQDYYTRKSAYPGGIMLDDAGNMYLCDSTCTSTNAVITVPLKSAAKPCADLTVTGASSGQTPGCSASSTSSTYCYGNVADGYQIGVCLETVGTPKDVYHAGSASTNCTLTCP